MYFPEKGYPGDAESLAKHRRVDWPAFVSELSRFVYDQRHPNSPVNSDSDDDVPELPQISARISVFHSATAIFYAPSDLCGVGGMRREVIRATPTWRCGPPRYDCVFVVTDPQAAGFRALHVARVKLFFSFKDNGKDYPCALVHWFETVGEQPHGDTGMWVVEPEFLGPANGTVARKPKLAIISIDSILRAAHLIPVFGDGFMSQDSSFSETLDKYEQFFVNKYADHHAYEIAF